LFEYQLAETLHMSVAEIRHGRGVPMSAHELTVCWPLYFEWKSRMAAEGHGQ
jgi:hypothetical protein